MAIKTSLNSRPKICFENPDKDRLKKDLAYLAIHIYSIIKIPDYFERAEAYRPISDIFPYYTDKGRQIEYIFEFYKNNPGARNKATKQDLFNIFTLLKKYPDMRIS